MPDNKKKQVRTKAVKKDKDGKIIKTIDSKAKNITKDAFTKMKTRPKAPVSGTKAFELMQENKKKTQKTGRNINKKSITKMKKKSMARKDEGLKALAAKNPNLQYKDSMAKLKKSMAKLKKDEKSAMAMKKKGAMMMKKASAMTMKMKKSMATMKKKSAVMMKKMAKKK